MLRPRHAFRTRALLLSAAAVFATACGSDDPTGPDDPGDPEPVASVAVNPASADLAIGATVSLGAVIRDAGGATLTGRTVTWSSYEDPAHFTRGFKRRYGVTPSRYRDESRRSRARSS